jgi:hypothetical protein
MSAAAVGGMAFGVTFAFTTTGLTLVGTAYSIRQFHILYQQAKLLEEVLREKEFAPPDVRVKDIMRGMLIGASAYIAVWGAVHNMHFLIAPFLWYIGRPRPPVSPYKY